MAAGGLAMTLSEIVVQTRRWHGLLLGGLVVAMMHLSGATSASRDNGGLAEPWPALLSIEPVSADPSVALLQRRAIDALEKLTQAGVEPL
jgi:hypothetical protein